MRIFPSLLLLFVSQYSAASFAASILSSTAQKRRNVLLPVSSFHKRPTTTKRRTAGFPRGGGGPVTRSHAASSSLLSYQEPPPLPTLSQYLKFALPCLGLWMANPLLSLVDTAFVGRSTTTSTSTTTALASLGPATTFFDGCTFLFMFLNVATTNLYASAHTKHDKHRVVQTAIYLAVRCGAVLMMSLWILAKPLLSLYIGDSAAIVNTATQYVLIRSLSLPTTLLLGVLQAGLLGAKDSMTPSMAIGVATVVNVIGDAMCVPRYGVVGAACATTVAQWACTLAMMWGVKTKGLLDGARSWGIWKLPQSSNSSSTADSSVTPRSFVTFAAPVLVLIMGKLSAFGFMTNAAAAAPGQPTPLAAHQIVLTLLFSCTPFLEVLSQTAQTFLPPYYTPVRDYLKQQSNATAQTSAATAFDFNAIISDDDNDPTLAHWTSTARSLVARLTILGFITSASVASLVSLVASRYSHLLLSSSHNNDDPNLLLLQTTIPSLSRWLWWGAFLWAPVAVSEGVLLAQRALPFLAILYLVSTAILPVVLMRVRSSGVEEVWKCFVVFQVIRAGVCVWKLWSSSFYWWLLRLFSGRRISNEAKVKQKQSQIENA